jgi:hypothetical protein
MTPHHMLSTAKTAKNATNIVFGLPSKPNEGFFKCIYTDLERLTVLDTERLPVLTRLLNSRPAAAWMRKTSWAPNERRVMGLLATP